MAPPSQKSSDMKQKSLMGYFGKPGTNNATSAKKTLANPASSAATSKPTAPAVNSKAKPIGWAPSSSSLVSDATGSSPVALQLPVIAARAQSEMSEVHDTPPTSDAPDVEMASSGAEDDDEPKVRSSATMHIMHGVTDVGTQAPTGKRKKVLLDSDEEMTYSARKPSGRCTKCARRKRSLTIYASVGRIKKPRITMPQLDDDDEEGDEVSAALSQHISRFKKSPVKPSGRQRSTSLCILS